MNQAKFDLERAGNKPSPRLGRKGFLYLQKTAQSIRPEEEVRITARRILKAERDERMDVTVALTPVKQYMSGFTRPKDLRTSNWFPGGSYIERGKVYESPAQEAYEPHTVFLFESRYNIRFGVGRVEAPEYIYGMCREQDLPAVLKIYNSEAAGREVLELMDNARWPWGPQAQPHRRVKWWTDSNDLNDTLKELGSEIKPSPFGEEHMVEEEDEDEPKTRTPMKTVQKKDKKTKASHRVTALNPIRARSNASSPPPDLPSPASARAFHSSSVLFVGHSYNDDRIVPDFYVQRKQAKAKEGEHQESDASEKPQLQDTPSLMDHLSDGIMSDEIVASTRRLPSKIPTELFNADGVLVHPSGFVIPTPSHSASPERPERERDLAQQTAAVAERVLEEDYTDVTAETSSRRGKVPFEVRHEDGTVSHPSGFEPPTAADDFEHSGNSTVDSHIGQQPLVLPGTKRGLHTSASARAEVISARQPEAYVPRSEYLLTLDETPFWRPLLTLTVSTRPIAHTLLRLSRGLETGRPFHAALSNDDKKCRISFAHRMRAIRLKRMQDLAVEMGQVLAGARGGAVGIRFETDSMGRGIGGDGLEDPLPMENRVISVGVGEYYQLAAELKELFRARGEDEIFESKPFNIFGLDDFGMKLDAQGAVVPWPTRPKTRGDTIKEEPWYAEYLGLRYAQMMFKRQAQAISKAGMERRPTPEDEDEVQELSLVEDLELSDDEGDSTGSRLPGLPIVLTKDNSEEVMHGLLTNAIEPGMSFAELDEPMPFVVKRPNGKLLVGPPGDAAKKMTVALKFPTSRVVVDRRLNMLYLAKHKELAIVLASRSNSVTYPDAFFHRSTDRGQRLVTNQRSDALADESDIIT
ncbi:hypothetical protein B0H17DRAFT_994872 [Mycena rosella]|uniref:Uncharacterized protein n=1 Tax=Mycena rosella TaxID=1033263 RepID=A0AAD7C648_MYCRO|nr:hypothetical protein B0H17DRAFT_994872 [Mycena rosella]